MVTLVALAKIYGIPPECFLHPEDFTDLETDWKRASKKISADPKSIGELSPDERRLIAEYRLKDTAGGENKEK